MTTRSFRFSDFELDGVRRVLTRGGETVSLNPKAFDLLLELVESRGQVLSKEQLLERVWPNQFIEEGNLKVHISALRKIFGENRNDHRFIVTVPGRGYSFVAELENDDRTGLLIESHSYSKIVVEEEITENELPAVKTGNQYVATSPALSRHDRPFVILAGVLAFLIVGLGMGYWLVNRNTLEPIRSLAVIPFVNESGNAELEYLTDGMTESLINNLSHLSSISVKARPSVDRYKGKELDIQKIGRDLNVHAVLTGRVVERGERFSLFLSLIDTRNGSQIWGESYDRGRTEIVKLQGDLARAVSSKLRAKLSAVDELGVAKTYTADPEAYVFYLKGRYHLNKRSPTDLKKAIDNFEQATALDPAYALAFAGLADSYSLLSNFGGSLPHETKPKARTAALKALALDETLAEAHTALGGILGDYDFDHAGEEREYRRAIELNPNLATTRHWYAEMLSRSGRNEEAASQYQKALEIDPLSLSINRSIAESLYYSRRYDECLAQVAKLQEMEPNFGGIYHTLAIVNLVLGDHQGAVEGLANFEDRMLGKKEFADQMRGSFNRRGWDGFLREMTGPQRPVNLPYYLIAVFHAALGEKDKAFANLDKAFDRRETFILSIKVDPLLDELRSDPRFSDLLKRVGLET